MVKIVFVVCMCLSLGRTSLSSSSLRRDNSCSPLKKCDLCIKRSSCSWCKDPDYKGPRCDLTKWFEAEDAREVRCRRLENPRSEIEATRVSPLSGDNVEKMEEFVQIWPQAIRVRTRVGRKNRVRFRVAHAKQYPVDLYYLMDLSNSMSDDKDTIEKLGKELAAAVQNITSDFQIGFGSFVDKEVMPFISLVEERNCQQDSGCPKPYSFQHQMSLSPDAKLFQARVKEAPISGNIDNPEGGLDGLVQVLVCGDRIGWRKSARRVVIFTTDQSFHIALDGKLGGIVTPNDGRCHLDDQGFFSRSTVFDYPSIAQVNSLASDSHTSIIFAVTADQLDLYSRVTDIVEGSFAGEISSDSSNIVDLVRKQYEAITTTIRVSTNSSSNCPTKITSKCPKGKNVCKNVPLGTAVEFELSLLLKECRKEVFAVSAAGIRDQLMVEVDPICECTCHVQDELALPEEARCLSPLCSGHGHTVCGVCVCCGDYGGPRCNCPKNTLAPESACVRPNATSSSELPCSGRGDCVCGKCECRQMAGRSDVQITGQFCEQVCDNSACERDPVTRRLCHGHGDCDCGRCTCEPPWTGPGCDCRVDPDACRSPDSPHLICSGRGDCPCDRCVCTTERFSGRFCHECETCPSVCAELKPCVECYAFGQEDNSTKDGSVNPCLDIGGPMCDFTFTERRPNNIPTEWENCTLRFAGCDYVFSYSDNDRTGRPPAVVVLHLSEDGKERAKVCPHDPDPLPLMFGLVGAIVCLGLMTLLLWRAFATITDRREFAKFEAERAHVKFPSHSNPIFKQATTTVYNPIFKSPHHF